MTLKHTLIGSINIHPLNQGTRSLLHQERDFLRTPSSSVSSLRASFTTSVSIVDTGRTKCIPFHAGILGMEIDHLNEVLSRIPTDCLGFHPIQNGKCSLHTSCILSPHTTRFSFCSPISALFHDKNPSLSVLTT